jgi:hypothetical protein
MAQLQTELVHGTRLEIEIKISIVRAQIMAEEDRFLYYQQSSLHQQPLQQQEEEYNRVLLRRTLPHSLSLEPGPDEKISYKTNSWTAASSVAAASMLPPMPFFGKTIRRIPEAEEVPSRMQWSDQGKEENKIKDNTSAAAAVAVGGWVCAENTRSSTSSSKRVISSMDDTSKTYSIITIDNNDKEVSNKRRRVVESIDCLLTLVNHRRRAATADNNNTSLLGPTTTSISITNHCRMHPLTYAGRGIQW